MLSWTIRRPPAVRDFDRRLHVESLEHRNMLAVFMVSNLTDAPVFSAGDAPGTLRQALFDANGSAGADTVGFQSGLTGTITLTAGELIINDALTIEGPGADLLTIDASGNDLLSPGTNDGSGSRVLDIDDGIINAAIPVEVRGLTLTGGDVSGDGGGIRSSENLTLTETKIVGNSAFGTSVRGGGVFSYGGNLILDRTTISSNSATGSGADGGGIFSTTRLFGSQSTSISNSSLIGNTTSNRGGGIFTGNNLLEAQMTKIVNSTISGNSAAIGGGAYAFDGTTVFLHSTITSNTSTTGLGGGIASFGDISTSTDLRSSLVSGNSGGDLAVLSGTHNSLHSSGYNLVGSGNAFGTTIQYSALDNFSALGDQAGVLDPGLAPLADNGGFTLTHALLPTSPAIDAGDPNAIANTGSVPGFDQRGIPFGRIEDGNGDSVARIDIGAFEQPPNSADFDGDSDIDGLDFLAWQRGFGVASGALKTDGDANNDGAVNDNDLTVWSNTFGDNPLPVVSAQAATISSALPSQSMGASAMGVRDAAFQALAVTSPRAKLRYLSNKPLLSESLPVRWTHRGHNATAHESVVAPASLSPNQAERVTADQDAAHVFSQPAHLRQEYLLEPELVDRLLSLLR